MPLIHVRLVEGTYDRGEKDELIAKLTSSVVAIKCEAVRPHVTVTLEEVKSGDWATGGNQATTELVLDLLGAPVAG
jgi:4-oxalocrotonate tautomerase